MCFIGFGQCNGVIYPGRLPEGGKRAGIHSSGRNPNVRQGKPYFGAGVAAGQLSSCGGHEHFPRAYVDCSAFPGSAGGGWWANLPWKLSLGPLPATTFL